MAFSRGINREKKIMDYISVHEGCRPTEAFEAVTDSMCRQKFFNLLRELKERRIIREEKRNKRDKSLFLNKNDLVVKVMEDLDHFESQYFDFIEKVFAKLKKSLATGTKLEIKGWTKKYLDGDFLPETIFLEPLVYFGLMMYNYSLKMSLIWPLSISDKRYLERLQTVTLVRISEMYSTLYTVLRKYKIEESLKSDLLKGNLNKSINLAMNCIVDLHKNSIDKEVFGVFGLTRDANNILDAIGLNSYIIPPTAFD